jgi:hypothetical protein
MCGIVGFITDEAAIGASNRRKWLIQALIADSLRGTDGTGAFFVGHKHDGAADWCKQGSHVYDFLDTKVAGQRFNQNFDKIRCAIGHNRSATVGKSSTDNSHPFQEGPITLVHNGTLHGTGTLPKSQHQLDGVNVDSHVITHNLAEHSAEEVISKLSGAFALVWHDARDGSINVVRNSDRPLHLMRAKCERTILIASEADMLVWLARRNHFKVGEVYYPNPGQYLKFMPDSKLEPIVTKVDLFSWASRSTGYSGRAYRRGEAGDSDYWLNDGGWKPGTGATGEGSNMGKEEAATKELPQDAKKALSKQSRLPRTLKKHLRAMNLEPLDKLRFRVTGFTRVHGTKYANVMGDLVDLSRQGILLGLPANDVVRAPLDKEVWTVAPIAERKGPGGAALLVRLVSRSVNFKTETTPPSSTSSEEATSSTSEEEPTEGMYELKQFTDWDRKTIHYHEWLRITAGGCVYCKDDLNPDDSDFILWDSTTKQPICPSCADELTQYEEKGVCLGS